MGAAHKAAHCTVLPAGFLLVNRWGREALARVYDEALGLVQPLPGVKIPHTEVRQQIHCAKVECVA